MTNPFLEPWQTPYESPPFDAMSAADFRPAYDAALAAHRREIASIAADASPPGFNNTIAALERAGALLKPVDMIFSQLTAAHTNDQLQAIERDLAPIVARHW